LWVKGLLIFSGYQFLRGEMLHGTSS
jgi:hypothetical protein